jgi:hypothetical protein
MACSRSRLASSMDSATSPIWKASVIIGATVHGIVVVHQNCIRASSEGAAFGREKIVVTCTVARQLIPCTDWTWNPGRSSVNPQGHRTGERITRAVYAAADHV